MRAVVRHAKFLLDHGRDALAGPHIAQKPIRLGTIAQQGRQLGLLLCGQARRRARGHAMDQGLGASFARPLEPLAHRARGHAQRLRDGTTRPTGLVQRPGAQPPPFVQLLSRGCDPSAHTSWCTRRTPPFTSWRSGQ